MAQILAVNDQGIERQEETAQSPTRAYPLRPGRLLSLLDRRHRAHERPDRREMLGKS